MARHEPHNRPAGDPAPEGKVTMRRDAMGNLVAVLPEKPKIATTEAKPRPQQAEDPRPAGVRNIPPYGAGI